MSLESYSDEFEVLVSYFGDQQLLFLFLENLPKWVRFVTVIDGTFDFAIKNFNLAGIGYADESLLKFKFKNLDIKYSKGIFKNEVQKRQFGFDQTRKKFIFVADIDEFFDFDESILIDFFDSNYGAAYFNCINYCSPEHVFSYAINGVKYYDYDVIYPRKFHLFNKEKVNSQRHLDYLWLVNSLTGNPEEALIYYKPLGDLYHASTIRSDQGALVKGIFYKSLADHDFIFDSNNLKLFGSRYFYLDTHAIPYSATAVISLDNSSLRNSQFKSLINNLFFRSVKIKNSIDVDVIGSGICFIPFYNLSGYKFKPFIKITPNERVFVDLFQYPLHLDNVGYKANGPKRFVIEKGESICIDDFSQESDICFNTLKLYMHAVEANIEIEYSSF